MALDAADKTVLLTTLMQVLSRERAPLPNITKPDLVGLIGAVDDWIDDNAASYNTALPTVARNNLSASNKAGLLYMVCLRRWEVG